MFGSDYPGDWECGTCGNWGVGERDNDEPCDICGETEDIVLHPRERSVEND